MTEFVNVYNRPDPEDLGWAVYWTQEDSYIDVDFVEDEQTAIARANQLVQDGYTNVKILQVVWKSKTTTTMTHV